jgi:hypothetical protein
MRERCKTLTPVSSNDDTWWFVQLVDRNMKELYKINLYLPVEFPTNPPQVSLSVVLEHEWVDPTTKRVWHPKLRHWNPRFEIGSILMEILSELTTKKPRIIADSDSNRRTSVAESSVTQSSVAEVLAIPSIPNEVHELVDLPLDILEKLESDPTELDKFIDSMALVSRYTRMKDDEKQKTLLVAQSTVSEQGTLNKSVTALDAVFDQLTSLKTELEKVMTERDAMMSKYTPKYLLNDLREIAELTDRQTSRIVKASDISLEELKSQLLQQRLLHHKAMALSELLSVHSGSHIIGSPRSASK